MNFFFALQHADKINLTTMLALPISGTESYHNK